MAQFHELPISELHDRMIAATTIASGAIALVTDDPEIAKYVPLYGPRSRVIC
ncbi:MAG TPA: hypothetical protein VKK79_22470 [Candidatus Lokiarchaeia archaeon]|nr:hypothetical protein [Candidatus Lokiarchaeia archaeon]